MLIEYPVHLHKNQEFMFWTSLDQHIPYCKFSLISIHWNCFHLKVNLLLLQVPDQKYPLWTSEKTRLAHTTLTLDEDLQGGQLVLSHSSHCRLRVQPPPPGSETCTKKRCRAHASALLSVDWLLPSAPNFTWSQCKSVNPQLCYLLCRVKTSKTAFCLLTTFLFLGIVYRRLLLIILI